MSVTVTCFSCFNCFPIRVEIGSDDKDNVGHLGHFFDGSSESHSLTILCGYEPDFLVN